MSDTQTTVTTGQRFVEAVGKEAVPIADELREGITAVEHKVDENRQMVGQAIAAATRLVDGLVGAETAPLVDQPQATGAVDKPGLCAELGRMLSYISSELDKERGELGNLLGMLNKLGNELFGPVPVADDVVPADEQAA